MTSSATKIGTSTVTAMAMASLGRESTSINLAVVADAELGEVGVSRSSLMKMSWSSPPSSSIVLASRSWVRGGGRGGP